MFICVRRINLVETASDSQSWELSLTTEEDDDFVQYDNVLVAIDKDGYSSDLSRLRRDGRRLVPTSQGELDLLEALEDEVRRYLEEHPTLLPVNAG